YRLSHHFTQDGLANDLRVRDLYRLRSAREGISETDKQSLTLGLNIGARQRSHTLLRLSDQCFPVGVGWCSLGLTETSSMYRVRKHFREGGNLQMRARIVAVDDSCRANHLDQFGARFVCDAH